MEEESTSVNRITENSPMDYDPGLRGMCMELMEDGFGEALLNILCKVTTGPPVIAGGYHWYLMRFLL